MERFQKIVWHEKYKETYERLQQLEIDRKFCGHDIEHFLSVARISYLMILEKDFLCPKISFMRLHCFMILGELISMKREFLTRKRERFLPRRS